MELPEGGDKKGRQRSEDDGKVSIEREKERAEREREKEDDGKVSHRRSIYLELYLLLSHS